MVRFELRRTVRLGVVLSGLEVLGHLGLTALPVFAALLVSPATAAATEGRFGPHDVREVFAITKNENRDQVSYGIRLDADCSPVGNEPVYAYWRLLERGPTVLDDLTWLDRKGYGIAGQWVTARGPSGGKVIVSLRATQERGIAIVSRKENGQCVAEAIALVAGAPARLHTIFVQLKGWLSVEYVELRGLRQPNNSPVVERVKI